MAYMAASSTNTQMRLVMGSRVGVPGGPACVHPTPYAALVNPVQSQCAMHPQLTAPRLQSRRLPGPYPATAAAQAGACP